MFGIVKVMEQESPINAKTQSSKEREEMKELKNTGTTEGTEYTELKKEIVDDSHGGPMPSDTCLGNHECPSSPFRAFRVFRGSIVFSSLRTLLLRVFAF
ncbi:MULTISPECIES: hypothetical protein [unclassified Wenzhouxiangella]|uniref:hypothetical protein n=1 Tax=unclassified Wenzhouxiangella TaxID=2613841 RepID=UPI0011C02F2C|nr:MULTISPECIES: hypothetical protein [unclassified Wenzhouxiangella]